MHQSVIRDQDIAFFRTFGYLHIRDWFHDEINWITEEFEQAWGASPGVVHDGSKRTIYPGMFLDASPRLSSLLEHPRVAAVCTALLGPDYGFHATDGNLYAGDTPWHSDAFADWPEKDTARHLKMAFYLDPLTRDTGALRVIPGSHLHGDVFCDLLERGLTSWGGGPPLGIPASEVPAVAIESLPGDLVCFDHRTKHAAFGGGARRRMFTANWHQGDHTPQMRESLLEIFRYGRRMGIDWNAPRGAWFNDAPAARLPLLRYLRDYGPIVMREHEQSLRDQQRPEPSLRA
jgi:ectoine hydroxylase-related dioxygenase (phytanoyl-CoA dioxygenase family)